MRTLRLGWVLDRKFKNGVLKKNKAPLVARSNHQYPGVDYGGSFSPVLHLDSLRTLLALAPFATSISFISTLPQSIYMAAQGGALHGVAGRYTAPGKGDWVWRLKKCLYELVQVGRSWNEDLNSHIVSEGLAATPKDPAV